MKNIFEKIFILMFFVLFACVLTGCNGDVENGDSCYVRFTEAGESASRGLATDEEDEASFDNLVWAYIAVKKDGMHTLGASEEVTAHTDGVTAKDSAERIYKLRPVREDYSKGLGMENGPFSYGEWEFRLYGYKSYDGSKFNDLVYTGVTVPGLTVINPLSATEISNGVTSVSVPFTLTDNRTDNKGKLVLGDIYFSVPDGLTLPNGSTLTVTVKQGSAFTSTATKTLTAEAHTGDRIGSLSFSSTSAEWTAGTYSLTVDATVTPSGGSAENITGSSFAYPLVISKGVTSTVSGDISDLKITNDTPVNVDVSIPLCKIGTNYYNNLQAAMDAATVSQVIELLRDAVDVGSITMSKTCYIRLNGHRITNMYVTKPSTAASGVQMFLVLDDSTTLTGYDSNVIHCGYEGTSFEIKSIYSDKVSKTAWLNTVSGMVCITAKDFDVWHSGTVDTVWAGYCACNKTANKGYHLLADVRVLLHITPESSHLNSPKFVDFGNVTVKEFNIGNLGQSAVVLRGREGTTISSFTKIDGTTGTVTTMRDWYDALDGKAIRSAFKKVSLYGFGDSKVLLGIEGMKVNVNSITLNGKSVTYWYKDLDMHNRIAASATYIVGEDSSLYAGNISVLAIGGQIYYIAAGDNGAKYTFYDSNYNLIADQSSVTALANAKYYTVVGNPEYDKFYVWNSAAVFNISDTKWFTVVLYAANRNKNITETYVSTVNGKTYTNHQHNPYDYVKRSMNDTAFKNHDLYKKGLGEGRDNTEWVMNLAGCSDKSTTLYTMDPDRYLASGTMWYYLKNTVNKAGTSNTTGLYDWYIPSMRELYELMKSGVSGLSTYGYTLGSSGVVHTSNSGAYASSGEWSYKGSCMWYMCSSGTTTAPSSGYQDSSFAGSFTYLPGMGTTAGKCAFIRSF